MTHEPSFSTVFRPVIFDRGQQLYGLRTNWNNPRFYPFTMALKSLKGKKYLPLEGANFRAFRTPSRWG